MMVESMRSSTAAPHSKPWGGSCIIRPPSRYQGKIAVSQHLNHTITDNGWLSKTAPTAYEPREHAHICGPGKAGRLPDSLTHPAKSSPVA